ncbi:MAG: hypothetical protein ACOYJS_06535 [Acutalibacteraceae bacterium]|jgi:hypothetical protein
MITLCETLPEIGSGKSAEILKIKCLYDCYKNDSKVLFWRQNEKDAVISMTDGNMIIWSGGADLDELKEFVNMLSPVCVFSDYNTLCGIDRRPDERINVLLRKADIKGETEGDELSSREIYELLDVDGLSLPEYPYFAVDYCRRLNLGKADNFAISGKCAAVSFNCGNQAIMNGIASHEKGFGTIALKGILQKNYGRDFFVCCRDSVMPFYEKNGFKWLYHSGYWVKNK